MGSTRKIKRKKEKDMLFAVERALRTNGTPTRAIPSLSEWKKHVRRETRRRLEEDRRRQQELDEKVGDWE